MVASLDVVSSGFDVATQVEVVLPHGQVAGQRARLWVKQGSRVERGLRICVIQEMKEMTKNIYTTSYEYAN